MKKEHMIIVALAVLLVAAGMYICYSMIQGKVVASQQAAFQQGAGMGYQQAVMDLVQQVVTCNEVPVQYGNKSVSVVAVECLRMAQQQQAMQNPAAPGALASGGMTEGKTGSKTSPTEE